MGNTIGIVVFEQAEELDFVGPWEVFTMAAQSNGQDRVLLIAEKLEPVRCAKGLRVVPDCTYADAPPLDVVLIPGGMGTRTEMSNPVLLDWLREIGPRCKWVTSVCTGALVLHAAGFLAGKRATTHWSMIDFLRELGSVTVLEKTRYVRDGNVVTAAGVSAGIDMALWLTGQLHDPDFARGVQHFIEYDPAPPYAAAV
ncbi:MAG TPA: DJ-1/PfpI family protein [Candidatus Binatia bacterium]|nr:DJ-1/PfpI family protein [Candidatus Binatia bacterium]